MEKLFKLKQHGTNAKTEVLAGVTTFITMIYIVVVNPSILSQSGMDWGSVFTATCLSAAIATLVMSLWGNLPFALAPGMGLNAFLTYTVCFGMGYSWQFALAAIFIEGIIFLLLTAFNVREAIVASIPNNLKKAISVGIGLFIAFIGLQNAGIVAPNAATAVELHLIKDLNGSFAPLVALIGLIITSILVVLKVPANLLIGIASTTIIGIPFGVTVWNGANLSFTPPSMAPTFLGCFEGFKMVAGGHFFDFIIVMFTFLFVDMFDTLGTLIGCAMKGKMTIQDKNGNTTIPNCKQALFADAIGTTIGALFGTSTVTTFVESSAGVVAGGRTGLTSLTTAILFILSLFLAPLFSSVPSAGTAPVLIIVGLYMCSSITEIDFTNDFSEAIPAFLTMLMMPLAYSIADGIMFGILSYVILKLVKRDYKAISPATWAIFVLFLLKIIVNNINLFK